MLLGEVKLYSINKRHRHKKIHRSNHGLTIAALSDQDPESWQ